MNAKTLLLIAVGVVAFSMGAIGQYWYYDRAMPPSDLWLSLVGAFLVFFWYRLDSNQRQYPRSVWLNIGVIALAVVALPYYFFRSRGAKHGFIATLLFLLSVVGWAVLGVAGQYAVWYGLQS